MPTATSLHSFEERERFGRIYTGGRVGVTHDASGRRLLTNRGQPLPEGYDDPNVIAEGEVVTGRRR